ncbi:MAG: DUF2958 domain-containing protein [Candidatus Omnitrophota bacterium]
MELLPEELAKTLPKLDEQEKNNKNDQIAYLRFYDPSSFWVWYVLEYDGVDTFFGLVRGDDVELGYFSLKELQDYKGSSGEGVKRDLDFQPTPLWEIWLELYS